MVKVLAALSFIAAVYAQPNPAQAQPEQQFSSTPAEQPPPAQSATAAKQAANPALEASPAAPSTYQVHRYMLKYQRAEDLLHAVAGYLGRPHITVPHFVWAERSTNSLMVNATLEEHEGLAQQIRAWDQPEDQIQIDTYVMQVSCNDDQFGTKHWSNTLGANGATFALTGNAGAASNSTFSQKPGGAFFNTGFLLQAPTVQATIRALIQRGKLKSINSPVTYTKTGEPVQIRSVQYQTIFMQTGAAATTPYNFTTGLTIDVVPRILEGGTIDLKINPALSAQTGTSPAQSVSNPAVPIISTVSAAAHVRIRSGEAAVIGGIAPLTDNDSKDGVPGVRNNSLLGYLLQSRQKMIARTNLVIIVSPKIVKRAPFKRDDRVGADQAGMVQNLTDLPLVDAKANRTIYIQQAKPEKPAATGQLH